MSLQTLVPGQIWYAQQPLKLGPFHLTTRSTFVRLANGEVWVHSPILPAPELIGAIAEIGPVKHVIAPNKSHHLFFLPFLQACRDAQGYIAPGLAEKRPDLAGFPIIPSAEGATWAAELDSLFIEGLPVINETVWLHKQSGTLILTDLLFCFGKDHALLARLAARLLGVYGRLGMSRSMKLLIKDRTGLYRCAQRILDWDDGMDSSPPHAVSYCAREFKRSDEESEMNSNVVGLDTAKSIFHLYSQAANDRPVKKKLRRAEMLSYFANLPVSLIGLEACGGAHYWARELTKLGHEVVLLNAKFVKAFVVGNKNDFNDAEAIFTAVTRPNKRKVAVKDDAQQDMQMLHRLRQERVAERTALANQMRGFLAERGIVLATGLNSVRKALPLILEDTDNALTSTGRELFAEQYQRLVAIDADIKAHEQRISRLCEQNALSKRFRDVPGVGPITATILASDIGDGKGYTRARDYAASLGVVPRQHSSGDKQVLLGISKRGNRYLRTLLIHGARSVLKVCSGKTDPLSRWLQGLIERRGFNKAAVALANKNARILWAMATQGKAYRAGA